MGISELIYRLNSHLPTAEQVIERRKTIGISITMEGATEEIVSQTVYLRRPILDEVDTNVFFELQFLLENTNISQVSIGRINFYQEMRVRNDKRIAVFASVNDFYKLCVSITTDQIFIFNEEGDELELLTSYLDHFLTFLCEYDKYHKKLIYGVEYDELEFKRELERLRQADFPQWFINDLINW